MDVKGYVQGSPGYVLNEEVCEGDRLLRINGQIDDDDAASVTMTMHASMLSIVTVCIVVGCSACLRSHVSGECESWAWIRGHATTQRAWRLVLYSVFMQPSCAHACCVSKEQCHTDVS
jgi:hypothetical protein